MHCMKKVIWCLFFFNTLTFALPKNQDNIIYFHENYVTSATELEKQGLLPKPSIQNPDTYEQMPPAKVVVVQDNSRRGCPSDCTNDILCTCGPCCLGIPLFCCFFGFFKLLGV